MSVEAAVMQSIKGLKCTQITRSGFSWRFDFQDIFTIHVNCPWRIISEKSIALGSEDDGQKFGLPEPLDGIKEAIRLLSEKTVTKATIEEITGDIAIEFDSNLRIEVFNHSSGYEGWECQSKSGLNVVGMGGGGITSFS